MKIPLVTTTLRLDGKELEKLKTNAKAIDSNYNQEARNAIASHNKKLERKINR